MTEDTLPVVAGKINAFMDKALKADEYRISAGVLLIEARQRVEAGEAGDITWQRWCLANVQRRQQDIRKVMRLAGATDPSAALREERRKAREGMQRVRERERANVSAPRDDYEMADLVACFQALSRRRQEEFLKQIGARWDAP